MAAPVVGDSGTGTGPGTGTGRIPGPSVTSLYTNGQSTAQFNPTMAVIIIVLVGGSFMLGFISMFVRKCMAGEMAAETSTTATTERSRSWRSKTRGLDKAAVDALPIVRITDLREKDHDAECPVCLTEFEPEDSLRLLPVCDHVFHQECIDAWFDSHSTCPLCRASLTGTDLSAENSSAVDIEQARRDPSPVATVVEVSENGDSDIELQPVSNAPTSREEARTDTATGAAISREDERTSARGTLSRNSQSFKRAARGTTALEKAASIDSSPRSLSSKPAAICKPPVSTATSIRRATSLGSDLIALRNLILSSNDQHGSTLSRTRSVTPQQGANSAWFTRAGSMDLATALSRDRTHLSSEHSRENWSTIDLEPGKQPSASKGESSRALASAAAAAAARPERLRSDRWSFASLRGAMFPLNRSSSDVSSHHLPV